jgi:hypothetical protein
MTFGPQPVPVPLPPVAAAPLGSRRTFYAAFSVLGLAAIGWPWRSAVAEDWIAGAAFLAAAPLLLTFGDRRAAWRKAAGVALWAGALACLARRAGWPAPVPPLESMITAALGALASGGAVYMGFWGTDMDDVAWARGLAPLGGLLLGMTAIAWSVPEGRGWIDVLTAEGARAGRAWWTAVGAWRWGGLALAGLAVAAAGRRKPGAARPGDGRNLNWNR